jgi:diguanylate cyclase (GGDEF)-like protein
MVAAPCLQSIAASFELHSPLMSRTLDWILLAANIAHLAQHDALTGLPTRTLLHDRLKMAMERSQRSKSPMALLMIDLDDFKSVNDVPGHAAGDELLVAVARRLEHTVRKSDTVARMGGDEFVSLELEITENVLVSDSSKAMRILDRLRALGLRIAIDDFGTGLSGMSYILRFNVNRLKIDHSFIRDITAERPSSAIARAIIAMATGLKINVVAEGVETSAIGDLLREAGCDDAQGFYYARPAPLADIRDVITNLEKTMSKSALVRRSKGSLPVTNVPLPMSA